MAKLPKFKSIAFTPIKSVVRFVFVLVKIGIKYLNRKVTFFRWQFNLLLVISISLGFAAGAYFFFGHFFRNVLAGDTSQTWNFAASGDYTVSDSSTIEIAGNSARQKVQEYSSDSDTAALYHLNDSSSVNIVDSSSYLNSGTGVGTFSMNTTGIMNTAATFNIAPNGFIKIADTAPISFTGSHTLEGWYKTSSAFSANSGGRDMGIIDKGTYKVYLDTETGKLTYELAPSNADSWTQVAGGSALGSSVNGGWDLNGKQFVLSSAVMGTDYYAGLGNGISDAEVWKWNGTIWTQVGGDGINSSWSDDSYEEVSAMAVNGTHLYVGLGNNASDGEVWDWNGTTWTKIGGDGTGVSPSSLGWAQAAPGPYEQVWSLVHDGTYLYAGLGTTAGDAEVWRWDGNNWTKIGGDSGVAPPGPNALGWGNGTSANIEAVYSLAWDGTYIYAGLGNTAGDAEIWRWNKGTSQWTMIGGDGTGLAAATYERVTSMVSGGGNLYVGLGDTTGDSDIFKWNGSTWSQVGGDTLNGGWGSATYQTVYSLAWDSTNSYLYAGLGSGNNLGDVWRFNGTAWSQIDTGFGNNSYQSVRALSMMGTTLYTGISQASSSAEVWTYTGTWTRIAGNYLNSSWGAYGLDSVESMVQVGDYLYAGTGKTVNSPIGIGDALVWRMDPSTGQWSVIGGQGINSSWAAYTYGYVHTMAGYNGDLYVGLGITPAGAAEVWKWNGSVWSLVGGDGTGVSPSTLGWANTTYEQVNSLLAYNGYLYAGLGNSANDAEVWRYNGTDWTKIGGDSLRSGWTTNYETVIAMTIYNNRLVVGLGVSAGDSEVWSFNDNGTEATTDDVWTKLGGDNVNGSWDPTGNVVHEEVDSLAVYKGDLYAGLGASAGDAEVWKFNGTTWTLVGGDGTGVSPSSLGWQDNAGTPSYERVRSMVTYNGELYAALGDTTTPNGDGEVWKYDGLNWTKIGGDTVNASWPSVGGALLEYVNVITVYKGKLYAGTGATTNADAQIWSYGNNLVLQTTSGTGDTSWHKFAAVYDGTKASLYVDGILAGTQPGSFSLLDTNTDLLIGSTYGTQEKPGRQGFFAGSIDEIRLSGVARNVTSLINTPYTTTSETVMPIAPYLSNDIKSYDGFLYTGTSPNGTIKFRLSNDNGSTWKYISGGNWVTSSDTTQVSTQAEISPLMSSFPVLPCRLGTTCGVKWQAVLTGDGFNQVKLNTTMITAFADVTNPLPPSSITGLNMLAGTTSITSGNWYSYPSPVFSWPSEGQPGGASDTGGSGIDGYYVYFGVGNTAVPSTSGAFQVGTTFAAPTLTPDTTYYLTIQSVDKAGRISDVYQAFTYKYDPSAPQNPDIVSVVPSGYTSTNSFRFFWSNPTNPDGQGSGLAGYQYKSGSTNPSDPFSQWSSTIAPGSIDLSLDNVAYKDGANLFYVRSVDNVGNMSTPAAPIQFFFAGTAPTPPRDLSASPDTDALHPATVNSFSFSWTVPSSYVGDVNGITYCYSVNKLPSASSCTYTSAGATGLYPFAAATVNGRNVLYLVAKDAVGNIDYDAVVSKEFFCETDAPGIPLTPEIADVSVKSTNSWKLALSWDVPEIGADKVNHYEIFRSETGTDGSFTSVATTSGIAFFDVNLESKEYYYKVRACDNVNNCGGFTTVVSMTPTGRFTEPAAMTSDPKVSGITTRKAQIDWTTDRISDTKISYGTKSDNYFDEEPSNSDQVTDHTISLSNLSPGTTYYYVAKWTDGDGNTGVSKEYNFKTAARPVISEVAAKNIGLTNAIIQFTSQASSKIRIYYGTTSSFGAFKESSLGTSKSVYTVELSNLQDGTKYYYKVNSFDVDGYEYEGDIYSFETLPRPKIANVRIQQVKNTAQPAVLISWSTNTETSSIVTYYPDGDLASARDEVNVTLIKGDHKILVKGLLANTGYTLVVKGRDKVGNEASSEPNKFTTATDTRPPLISELVVEGGIAVSRDKGTTSAQLVITWNTDEGATSQVEYGEGTGSVYSQKTQEDSSTTFNHMVLISGLTPSKVYHLRVISKDSAGNEIKSVDTVTITPKASDDALNLVISNLSEVFGFLGGLKK